MPPLVKLKDIVDELSFQSDKAFRATEEEETLDHFPDWMHDMLRTAKDILELTTISHCRPSVRKTAFRIRTKEPWRIQPHGFLLDTSANACMVAPTRKRPSD